MSHSRWLMIVVAVVTASACSLLPGQGPAEITAVTVRVEGAPSGDPATATRATLLRRLELAGFEDVTVRTVDPQNLRITVSGTHDRPEFDGLLGLGRVAFRMVVNATTLPPSAAGAASPPRPGQPASPAAVLAQLGPAAAVAAQLTAPPTDPAVLGALAPFGTLTPSEVAVLPASTQFLVPLISCSTLDARPAGAIHDVTATVVACDDTLKYLLDPAKVVGSDIAEARATLTGGDWAVEIHFTDAGQPAWTALTQEAVDPTACEKPVNEHCQVAIVVDNAVVSAPTMDAVIPGEAVLAGGYTAATAGELAAQVGGGVLPYRLTITDISVLGPKLGR